MFNTPIITFAQAPPDKANGTAVIVMPGGGYQALATGPEGQDPADWLNSRGVSAFVLQYRIVVGDFRPLPLHPAPMVDIQRAVRVVRYNAKAFGIDPSRIGVWGFSAGGHLASIAATHFDGGNPQSPDAIERVSSRPDFAIMAYPLIYLGKGSNPVVQTNLVGSRPTQEVLDYYSSDKQVTPQTPPCFIFHTTKDQVVPVDHSRRFKAACDKHGVSATYLELLQGPHGVAMGTQYQDIPAGHWTDVLDKWLNQQGLYKVSKDRNNTNPAPAPSMPPANGTPTGTQQP
jgi:acetyl esterase/lipase